MGPSFVILFELSFSKGSKLADIGEQTGIEKGFAAHAVKSFDTSFLHGPTGLNKLKKSEFLT